MRRCDGYAFFILVFFQVITLDQHVLLKRCSLFVHLLPAGQFFLILVLCVHVVSVVCCWVALTCLNYLLEFTWC